MDEAFGAGAVSIVLELRHRIACHVLIYSKILSCPLFFTVLWLLCHGGLWVWCIPEIQSCEGWSACPGWENYHHWNCLSLCLLNSDMFCCWHQLVQIFCLYICHTWRNNIEHFKWLHPPVGFTFCFPSRYLTCTLNGVSNILSEHEWVQLSLLFLSTFISVNIFQFVLGFNQCFTDKWVLTRYNCWVIVFFLFCGCLIYCILLLRLRPCMYSVHFCEPLLLGFSISLFWIWEIYVMNLCCKCCKVSAGTLYHGCVQTEQLHIVEIQY